MKYLLGLFLSFSFFVHAQYQFDFPVEGAVWLESYQQLGFTEIPYPENIREYSVKGDTVIEGYVYKKIYFKSLINIFQGGDYYEKTHSDPIYYSAMRMDENKNVYALYDLEIQADERLLYCFGSEIGDSCISNSVSPGEDIYIVEAIDTLVYCDNVPRKTFKDESTVNIIEGIGSSVGVFVVSQPFEGGAYQLLCYKENDETVYCQECNKINDVLGGVEFLPFPVFELLQKENEINISSQEMIVGVFVYDLSGKNKFIKNTKSNKVVVSKSEWGTGLHLIHVKIEGGEMVVEKVWVY